jgi:hypothetical protein
MITPDAPAGIHHLFPLMAPLAFSSLNDVALVALSITGSTLAAKRSAFVLVEDDAVTLRLPELWGAPWLRARKLALPHPVAIDPDRTSAQSSSRTNCNPLFVCCAAMLSSLQGASSIPRHMGQPKFITLLR